MELIEPSLILEQHLEEPSPSLEHLIKSIVEPYLDGALHLLFLFVLGIPDVVGDELLDLRSLLRGEV